MAIAKPPAGCRRYNAFPILPIRPLRSVLRGSFVTLVTPGFYLRAVTIVVGSAIRFFCSSLVVASDCGIGVVSSWIGRTYDIFEKSPNGQVLWRASMIGRERSLRKLQELAAASRNEVFAMHLPTKEVIATLNPVQPQ